MNNVVEVAGEVIGEAISEVLDGIRWRFRRRWVIVAVCVDPDCRYNPHEWDVKFFRFHRSGVNALPTATHRYRTDFERIELRRR